MYHDTIPAMVHGAKSEKVRAQRHEFITNPRDDLNEGRNPAPMGPREETRLTIVLPLGFRQNLFPPVPGTASESFLLPKMEERLAAAGAGGKGRGAGGQAAASLSWQAARAQAAGPSSLAGRPPGPSTSRTRNFKFKLAGELDLAPVVFQAPAGRAMGQFSS